MWYNKYKLNNNIKNMSSNYMVKSAAVSMVVSSILLTTAVFAAKPAPGADITNLSYVFHLYYDNGKLYSDRDYQIKYDVVEGKYIPETVGATPYLGVILNFKDKVIDTFKFDPGNGKISVKGPYAADAKVVNFFDNHGTQLLSLFVSDSSFCNDNDYCDQATGENDKTCPNDCNPAKTQPPLASTSVNPNPANAPNPPGPPGSSSASAKPGLMTILIYVFTGLAAVAVAWVAWRWWKGRSSSSLPADSGSMPMPPPPPVG